ncbi:mitochondrial carrier domain-containing protein [Obelidium mucronatum]|nr:mitochondrial carrier domain-containing protein [Obelidium mucronatum]
MAAKPQKQKDSFYVALAKDFAAGGVSGAVSKTITAPIERVKLVIQTQDANPKIISGEVPRYTGNLYLLHLPARGADSAWFFQLGIGNAFTRIAKEQGMGAFWRGNLTNCIRYFPTQAINLASKDFFKGMFPKYNPKTEFWPFFAANMASGGAAGAFSLSFVYPLDYARTRLASDVGSGKRQFNGLWDCLAKTARGPKGFLGLYQGFGISVAGIIPYRGVQFGLNDTIKGLNPWDKETTFIGIASKWAGAQFSVIMSGYVTYPFDTVRRRLQMEAEKPIDQRIYKGAIHCFNTIVAKEGTKALFKGAGANILRGTGAALVLVLYGEIQAMLKA